MIKNGGTWWTEMSVVRALGRGDESFCSPGSSLIAEFSEVLTGHGPHLSSSLFGSTRWAFLSRWASLLRALDTSNFLSVTCQLHMWCAATTFPSVFIHLNGNCLTGTCSPGRTVAMWI